MATHIMRTERSGSIFYRITGLIRAKQLKWENRPLWYDVYAAIPPLTEPVWNQKFPKEGEVIPKIFYKEDIIRAQFYKRFRSVGAMSVENTKTKSISALFIEQYFTEEKNNPQMNKDELFEKTVQTLEANGISLSSTYRRPLKKQERGKTL